MAVIRIQERTGNTDGTNAIVSFDNGPEYPITITNPFDEKQEQELEWYFEEHLEFPFTKKVRAQTAAASITTYGETLFKQVFGDPEIYAEYRALLKVDLHDLQIEIAGSPKFHALHWESIKDPKTAQQPLALQATMVRKNLQSQVIPSSVRPWPTINLLIVTARPSGIHDVGYRTISRPLVDSIRNANLNVQVEILRPGTYKALENHLRDVTNKHGEGYYHVIHFDVHGTVFNNKAYLFFEGDEVYKTGSVNAVELAKLLRNHQIPVAILNACQSGKQIGERETSLGSHLIQAGMQLVLAMGYSVTVSAAELMMSSLYQHLFVGDDLVVAIRHVRTKLYNNKERRAYFDQKIDLEDWLLPVVYQNQPVTLQPREFTLEERTAWDERKAEEKRNTSPDPQYGFVGRDIDILQIEKRLLTKRNILLVRGMVVAGKTTLLRHLTTWWQTTGFVQHVFYIGYDEKAWTLQQIMTSIAQDLYGPKYYTDFQPLSLSAQQAMLSQKLRSENHLLILDNLESITGAHLAIQHTLPQEDKDDLHSFLIDLAKGNTFVLLGSRSDESWLAKGTYDDNIYNLPGIDPEAASTLAEHILEGSNSTKYLQDEDLRKLIKVLDGFPLVLEVVLANLVHHTPVEVLAALQSGDVSIDLKSDSWNKTKNILSFIDYSYCNLSLEAQQLFICLAPFTSVIDTGELDNYTFHLKQQPTLATLPFERWSEVLLEAENWGLLSYDSNIPGYLRLQPIFPYFLRYHLNKTEHVAEENAISTAFRLHYTQVGDKLKRLLDSKHPQERQKGQVLTELEYENLFTALDLSLIAKVSIGNIYFSLSTYFDVIQDQRLGLELGRIILDAFETYPDEQIVGPLGIELIKVMGTIANYEYLLKQYSAAEVSNQNILKLVNRLEPLDEKERNKLKAMVFHQLGMLFQDQRQWQQAEQYYKQALLNSINHNDLQMQAKIYHQLGNMALEQQQWIRAEQCYQSTLKIYIKLNDYVAQTSTFHQLARVAQEQRRWQQAELYFQQALQISKDQNFQYDQGRIYHNLGGVAQEQRQWQQAEQYYQQALQIFIEYKDRYLQAKTYHQLGMVAFEQQKLMQAEQYYKQAFQIFIEYNDRHAQASALFHLGIVTHDQCQWRRTDQYYRQALQIYIEYSDLYEQARVHHQLGNLALDQQQLMQAEQHYQQALQIYIEYNDRYSQAKTYGQLGLLEREREQWSQARDYLVRVLEIFIFFEDEYNLEITIINLARLWKASNEVSILIKVSTTLEVSRDEIERLFHKIVAEE